MKKLIRSGLLAIALTTVSYGQGTITLDNLQNTDNANPNATANGLFWVKNYSSPPVLMSDVEYPALNVQFYGGSSIFSMALLVTYNDANLGWGATFLNAGSGSFVDFQNGTIFTIPGVTDGTLGWYRLDLWLGPASTYAGALTDPLNIHASTGNFQNQTGSGSGIPTDLTGMPAVVFSVPEPGTFALAGLGLVSLLVARKRK